MNNPKPYTARRVDNKELVEGWLFLQNDKTYIYPIGSRLDLLVKSGLMKSPPKVSAKIRT